MTTAGIYMSQCRCSVLIILLHQNTYQISFLVLVLQLKLGYTEAMSYLRKEKKKRSVLSEVHNRKQNQEERQRVDTQQKFDPLTKSQTSSYFESFAIFNSRITVLHLNLIVTCCCCAITSKTTAKFRLQIQLDQPFVCCCVFT